MRSKKSVRLALTPELALNILTRLVDGGAVSMADVEKVRAQIDVEIATLEARLAELRGYATPGSNKSARRNGKRRTASSPELARSRRLQGEYMGLIRHLGARDRARIKTVAAESGRDAAIRAMRTLTSES